MIVIEDKAQKIGKHELKHSYFESCGVSLKRYPLPVGDYVLENNRLSDVILRKKKRGVEVKKMDLLGTYDVSVDTKFSIQEIESNVCGKQHDRFRDECILAKNNYIKLYVLVENDDEVKSIDDLKKWDNPRLHTQKWVTTPGGERRKVLKYPKATSGETLAKALNTMQERYGVIFKFCSPEEAGAMVLELLGVEVET